MNLKERIQQANKDIKEIDDKPISKLNKFKCSFCSIIFILLLSIPFILIFVSLLKQIPHIAIEYYLIMIAICLLLSMINPLMTIIYYDCLKYYLKDDPEYHKINFTNIFIRELLNPSIPVIIVVIIVLVNIFIWR